MATTKRIRWYKPLADFAQRNGVALHIVDNAQDLSDKELLTENVYSLRTKTGAQGERVLFKARIHGRTDLVCLDPLPAAGHILRWMVLFAVEVKRAQDYKQDSSEMEAMLQVVGLNVGNSRRAPPVVLTNLAQTHVVFYLFKNSDDPLRFEIRKKICASVLCAFRVAHDLATDGARQELARDFCREPTRQTTPVDVGANSEGASPRPEGSPPQLPPGVAVAETP